MKLICTQNNFRKAVFNTERVTGKQTTLPILGNILLKAEKRRLKFSATNLEVGVITNIGAKIEKEGEITIPVKLLSNFINNLPNEDKISLETKNQNLNIVSGGYKTQIKGLSADDFPIIPKLKNNFLFSISAQKLKNVLVKVLFCVALNENRPEFTGINMVFFDKNMTLAATDSFRLAEVNLKFDGNEVGEGYGDFISRKNSIIIPANTFSEVVRVISPETEKVKVAIEENQIFFEIDNVQIVSRLINGKYPDYKQIIPQKFNTRVVLNKDELLKAVKVASMFADSGSGEVIFKVEPTGGKLITQSQSHESGESKVVLKADIIGPKQEVVLNPRYIMDGISAMSSSSVAILVNDGLSPVGLKAVSDKDGKVLGGHVYIIMPIKK